MFLPEGLILPIPNLPTEISLALRVICGMFWIGVAFATYRGYGHHSVGADLFAERMEKSFFIFGPGISTYVLGFSALAANVPTVLQHFQVFFLPPLFTMHFGWARRDWISLTRSYYDGGMRVYNRLQKEAENLGSYLL